MATVRSSTNHDLPKLDPAIDAAVRKALKAGGKGMQKIAAELGVGVGTVQRAKAAMEAECDQSCTGSTRTHDCP